MKFTPTTQGLAERIMCTSELELIDTKYGQKDTNLLDKSNAIEPCGIQYLAECYSRAENEARSERRKFKDDELRAHIIKKCQEQIIDKAWYEFIFMLSSSNLISF